MSLATHAIGTGSSLVVDRCQSCGSRELEPLLFVGYLPPVNTMPKIGTPPAEQPAYPAQLLRCPACELVQLGLVVDPKILFPPEYPYTSGTTRMLRENFAELAAEAGPLLGLGPADLVVDVGWNDGTLLSNFQAAGHRVRGVEPMDTGKLAQARGVPTFIAFSGEEAVDRVLHEDGLARVVTAANVFAHIEDVHAVINGILRLLTPDGVFISESHYWISLLETLQYDTIYHEHLRYYSLTSLRKPAGSPRSRGVPREADPDARRIDPRVRRPHGTRSCPRQRARDPGARVTRAGHRRARALPHGRARVEAGSPRAAARHQGTWRAHLRHRRAIAREHACELRGSR